MSRDLAWVLLILVFVYGFFMNLHYSKKKKAFEDEANRQKNQALTKQLSALKDQNDVLIKENAGLSAALRKMEAQPPPAPDLKEYVKKETYDHLLQKNVEMDLDLAVLQHKIDKLNRMIAFGPILKKHGEEKFVLTADDYENIYYPVLNPEVVYYAAYSKRYHAVNWCYTLDTASAVNRCSVEEAERNGLTPCSKCIDLYYETNSGAFSKG